MQASFYTRSTVGNLTFNQNKVRSPEVKIGHSPNPQSKAYFQYNLSRDKVSKGKLYASKSFIGKSEHCFYNSTVNQMERHYTQITEKLVDNKYQLRQKRQKENPKFQNQKVVQQVDYKNRFDETFQKIGNCQKQITQNYFRSTMPQKSSQQNSTEQLSIHSIVQLKQKIKKQSIRRLQSKVGQYLTLLDNLKEKTKQQNKLKMQKIKKLQKIKVLYQSQVSKEDQKNIQKLNITSPKANLKTQSETPPSISSQQNFSKQIAKYKQMYNPKEVFSQVSIKDFFIIKKIGQGRLGQVLVAIHNKTKSVYALKKISKKIIIQNNLLSNLIKQIKIQSFIDNPNVVKIYGFFNDLQNIYIIEEYLEDGSLQEEMVHRNYHKNNTQLYDEDDSCLIFKDTLNALNSLHLKEIMHRDIKPANIVISNGVYKLCDFGWATSNPGEQRRATYCGTFDYAPPQIIIGEQYGLKVDLWQFGVFAFEIVVGKLPFYSKNRKQSLLNVVNYKGNLNFPKNISSEMKHFILSALQRNPEERLSCSELINHSLIANMKNSYCIE